MGRSCSNDSFKRRTFCSSSLSHSTCCCVPSRSDSSLSVVLEVAELNVGGVSSLDVEGPCKMTYLLGLGDSLGWDFAKGKITGTLFM